MNIYTLLCVGFIFTGIFTRLPAKHQGIPYEDLLACMLHAHEVEQFVLTCRRLPPEKFQNALEEVLAKADENKINKAVLLKNMCQCLQQKIATINRLQATHIDWDELRKASILMMGALMWGAGAYGIYVLSHDPDWYRLHSRPENPSITQVIWLLGGMSIAYLIMAIFAARDSLHPIREDQYEDQYLDTYKEFLEITKLFIRQHFHKGSLP